MTSSSARKGNQYERDVVTYLQANGHPDAERTYGAGRPDDHGDIRGVNGWVLQLKNTRTIELAVALNEANEQRIRNRSPWCAAIVKRRQRPVRDSYVVMDLATFAEITCTTSIQLPPPA